MHPDPARHRANGQTDGAVRLIHGADGLHAGVMLGQARSIDQPVVPSSPVRV
jgi:hypothetical protein